jgi:hypothetical protein
MRAVNCTSFGVASFSRSRCLRAASSSAFWWRQGEPRGGRRGRVCGPPRKARPRRRGGGCAPAPRRRRSAATPEPPAAPAARRAPPHPSLRRRKLLPVYDFRHHRVARPRHLHKVQPQLARPHERRCCGHDLVVRRGRRRGEGWRREAGARGGVPRQSARGCLSRLNSPSSMHLAIQNSTLLAPTSLLPSGRMARTCGARSSSLRRGLGRCGAGAAGARRGGGGGGAARFCWRLLGRGVGEGGMVRRGRLQ